MLVFNFLTMDPNAAQYLPGSVPKAVAADTGANWSLTILHTNDTHAYLQDLNTPPSNLQNIVRRAAEITSIRSKSANSILLDAGDVFSGTLFFTKYLGQADLEFMNLLGYDAMGLGNHEFDKGPQVLADFVSRADFPIVNANFDFSGEPALKDLSSTNIGDAAAGKLAGKIYPAVILNVNGEKVGILGVTAEDTKELSSPGPGIKISNALTAAQNAVSQLEQKGITKIIAISHLGWDNDTALAKAVKGIDVIVDGHSHTLPKAPQLIEEGNSTTLVVQAGEYGKFLDKLDVTFDTAGKVIPSLSTGTLVEIKAQEEDTALKKKLEDYAKPIKDTMSEVISQSSVELDGVRDNVRTKETNLGNLVADAMLEKAAAWGATLAITNGGGIRASIDKGPITRGEVLTVMPFGNYLMVLELTGEQIIKALDNGVSQVESKAGRFPQVAGLKFTYDPSKPVGSRVVSAAVKTGSGYVPIAPKSKYLVATNNFMADGGDGYVSFKEASKSIPLGFVDWEVFVEYLAKHQPVNPTVEGRINFTFSSLDINAINLFIGSQNGYLSGKIKPLEAAPMIIKNRTMVPLRFIGEALGADITWDGLTRIIIIRHENRILTLVVDKESPGLDVPPIIEKNITFVPIRFISQAFGAQVNWDPANKSVSIIK